MIFYKTEAAWWLNGKCLPFGRVPGSKPDSTEDPPCMGPAKCQVIAVVASKRQLLVWREAWREGASQVSSRHLTAVQNCEVRPKITRVVKRNFNINNSNT
ncbi:hypothetical protein AVEN_246540-1 [Araneus ventricosus]|uniref:Uncharacterized protein n=1 Tax=Araneus ventricosus TaxID=182803 RepID=A0A4Y2K5A5_ARAVE|nr:hypothetical protein AVEN_246540-1 [Araneus ventricosus]